MGGPMEPPLRGKYSLGQWGDRMATEGTQIRSRDGAPFWLGGNAGACILQSRRVKHLSIFTKMADTVILHRIQLDMEH